MAKVTVVIPARNEIFLSNTIRDVLKNARGDIAVYPVLDGYDIPESEIIRDTRVNYIKLLKPDNETFTQKRHGINQVIAQTSGEFVMSLDAHCMVAEGFDVELARVCKNNTVLIPRRNRLDAANWCIQTQSDNRPPIDYEHTQWVLRFNPPGLHGFRWDERTLTRLDIPIDETMHFQGSCWFMPRDFYRDMHFMQTEGYTGWGQEAEEIGLETWRVGGQVLTVKSTWYAHLHKGNVYGRMWKQSRNSVHVCNAYSYNLWVYERRAFFAKFIERFWPVPGWPHDWQAKLYN